MFVKVLRGLTGLLVCFGSVHAGDVIQNGHFEQGKAFWAGNGQIVYLDSEGEPVSDSQEGTPVMEVKLNRTDFTSIEQRIRTDRDTRQLSVEAVISTSADFRPEEKSSRYSRGIDWGPGTWYWSAWVKPKADVILAVKTGMNLFKTDKLSPGASSRKIQVQWDLGNGGVSGLFMVIFPPGEGTAYVHSVTATESK